MNSVTTPNVTKSESRAPLLEQPNDTRSLSLSLRDALIISMRKVDGVWLIVSTYCDDVWWLTGAPTNVAKSRTKIDFTTIPEPFRESMKGMMYRYMRKGCNGSKRPGASTLARSFREISYFLQYVHKLGIAALRDITPLVCHNYVHASKTKRNRGDKPPNPQSLYKRIKPIIDVYLLSQYTDDPVAAHPWPDSSSHHLAGSSKSNVRNITPLIPDDVFVSLFQAAWKVVQGAPHLLDCRDEMTRFAEEKRHLHPKYVNMLKAKLLTDFGIEGSYKQFKTTLVEIRTACYIVIASLSGCRNHELAHLRSNSYCSTEDNDGEQYWWMRSISTKTFEGLTEWMVPEAAVVALRVMERWAKPYQDRLRNEIDAYRAEGTNDVRIALAEDHLDALFVGLDLRKGNYVRTLSTQTLNTNLREFAQKCGLNWPFASHQFRRKFANYAARSQFGDLRYLKEHFKHWSMDMTLGYALNESQEMALYVEIQDEIDEIKEGVVATWLDDSESLAGGYGDSLVDWRSKDENITLFKSHAAMVRSIAQSTPIRSNGHAWCTADDNQCVGNNLEQTRCGAGCGNAVIGHQHAKIYQGLYTQLKQLESSEDIGPGGRERVLRDVTRCANVLGKLGYEVNEITS